ncbi:MAG: 4-hydroxy-tetrahydrodipicolinate reductase [Prevotellaceae bacterium]|jgi:4-hydroxy-tetrahydrodipicolinate reductase|nr:4-hydroxy-tetrahydrodipicolinate reductase [Prevotellaceae bacterium]
MKIALIGYGKMGRTIERLALERGHSITVRIDVNNTADIRSAEFKSSDVAIEFTSPETAFKNVATALELGVSVVCGTTGWTDGIEEIKRLNAEKQQGFIYSSNFSLGVNIFFHINRKLAEIMNRYPDYCPAIEEVHHIHKKDAPSGTALTLAEDIISRSAFKKWSIDNEEGALPINAIRRGEVPGIHSVRYENEVDTIEITHNAKSRDGFALGAVIAAEYLAGKKGFFTMKEVLGLE